MPIYEYECKTCGKNHEIMQKITDQPLSVCPDCGGKLRKIISNTSFVLKGSGWYATDYASGKGTTEKKSEASGSSSAGKKEEKKPDTPASGSKTAA